MYSTKQAVIRDPNDAPEVYQPVVQQDFGRHDAAQAARPAPRRTTICGLAKQTFWCGLAIAILFGVIIGLAVGLGMGLFAARARDVGSGTAAQSSASSTPAIGSVASTSSPGRSSTSASGASSTASHTTSTTSTSTPLSAPSCPKDNGTTISDGLGPRTFMILCDSDWGGSGKRTLSSLALPSFDQCVSLCNTMNWFQGRTDVGVTYNLAGTGGQAPGTCWCLGGTTVTGTNVGNIVASPIAEAPIATVKIKE